MSAWSCAVAGTTICVLGVFMLAPTWVRELRAWLR